MRLQFYRNGKKDDVECDKFIVFDIFDRPIILAIQIRPDLVIYSHCGEKEFSSYLEHFGLKAPPTIIYHEKDIRLYNGNNGRENIG
ncbi:MAG: hypothetical protein QXQ37_02990 [Nitrososphaerota archaeon]